MKKELKAIKGLAVGGLTLGALSTAGAKMGGTNLVGNLSQGLGPMMAPTGSILGASMVVKAAKGLQPNIRRKR